MALDTVIMEIIGERVRQIDEEGFTPEHDDSLDAGELAGAGAAYALYVADKLHPQSQGDGFGQGDIPPGWCWEAGWFKPDDSRYSLIKAAALIVAEIERLDRNS